jgi:hypothetical protein
MRAKYNSDQIVAIENAVKHFEHWRATTERGQRRMSEELRTMAIDLSQKVGVHCASKALGLNCTDLKRWGEKGEPTNKGNFTEITLLPSTNFSCRVEIAKNDTRINFSLEHSSVEQMVALVKGVL